MIADGDDDDEEGIGMDWTVYKKGLRVKSRGWLSPNVCPLFGENHQHDRDENGDKYHHGDDDPLWLIVIMIVM